MNQNMANKARGRRLWVSAAFAAIFAAAALSGCVGKDDAGTGNNKAPTAKLSTDKHVDWSGAQFVFDASQSSDPDGEISEYRFDFGDNTPPVTVRDKDSSKNVRHSYLHGGEFAVTLTVFDKGADQTGSLSDSDSVKLAVNQKTMTDRLVMYAAPGGNEHTSKSDQAFSTYDGVDRVEATFRINSTLPAGGSQIRITIYDADNKTVDTQTVTLNAGQSETVNLDGVMTEESEKNRVSFEALSGGAAIDGDIRTYYDKGFTV